MNPVKRILAIHDLCGFGRCSLSVIIPTLSAMGHQCCSLPTAFFSNPTNYPEFTLHDLTGEMKPVLDRFHQMPTRFAAIYSGFMASAEQMDLVKYAASLSPDALLVVDPVMGDGGRTYPTYTEEMCARMRILAEAADVIVPNVTEAAILLDEPYENRPKTEQAAREWLSRLSKSGLRAAVITGMRLQEHGEEIVTGYYDAAAQTEGFQSQPMAGRMYHGTGDTFAAVLTGMLVKKSPLRDAVTAAARFVRDCAAKTFALQTEPEEGVLLEAVLPGYVWSPDGEGGGS